LGKQQRVLPEGVVEKAGVEKANKDLTNIQKSNTIK
jgi:hypothetical protein